MEYLFDDVLEIKNGKNQKAVENPDGQYPIYGSGGIMGYADDYICDADTVIIGRKGSINNPIYVAEPFWNVDTAFGLSAKKEHLLPRYLFYFCKKFDFEKLNKTVTIPSLTKSDLLKIKIDLPSKEEQQYVVNKLTKIEKVIDFRRQELSALDNLIKARFVELFGNCKEKCKLSEYAELITKGASPRWQGVEYSDNEEGTLFVTSENVREGFIDYSKRKYLPNEINDILPRSVLKRNDVLINIVNASIGRAAIYESDDLANINQAVALVRLKPDSLNLKFLLAFLNSDEAIRAYDYMKVGGDKANLSLKNISDLQIPVADMSVQNQFADFTKQVDKSKFVLFFYIYLKLSCGILHALNITYNTARFFIYKQNIRY